MDSGNLKHRQLPIRYSEEDGWALGEEDLNNHIRAHFDELRQNTLAAKEISNKKIGVVVLLTVAITVIISSMALAGAHLWAFILALVALADVSPILKFLEKSD
jgi:hypothetical protein